MGKQFIKDGLGWGILLWLIGYLLGIVFFMFVPKSLIGWVIMPIGTMVTMWVLFKKVKSNSLLYFLKISLIWTIIAVLFDYFFLVKLFKPEDGYYKLDVYLYYLLTFALPILVWCYKSIDKTGKEVKA